jgi:MtrB/PioB family decaheme-associated outer membrane protein
MQRTLIALAIAAAFASVHAQEAEDKSGTTVRAGVGVSSGDQRDRARFGLFNGLRENETNLLLDIRYANTEEGAPSWTVIEGRNLGLDSRELSYAYRRFGDVKLRAYYSEVTRHDPRTINTSLRGAGSPTPTVTLLAVPKTGQDLNLKIKREALGLDAEKWIYGNWQGEVSFRTEDKSGARFWGRGFACSASWAAVGACSATNNTAAAVLMLPEPLDSTHRQFEAKLNYFDGRLSLSGGYYGSFYTNRYGSLTPTISGGLGNQNGGANPTNAGLITTLSTPMALWPDNQAHQFSVAGNYALAPKTRVNFKYAYTRATQNEDFGGMGLTGAPAGRSNLGGEINTHKAQVGFSAHPLKDVHLHGDVSYNKKQNKTPLDYYAIFYTNATGGQRRFTNANQSPVKLDAKLEAAWKFLPQYTAVGTLKYEHEDFGPWVQSDQPGGVSGLKQKLQEVGWKAELRRVMSENLTGSVSWEHARREGTSSWLRPVSFATGTGVTEVGDDAIYSRTAIFPFIYMDRERDKARLMVNWQPMPRLDVQVFADRGIDRYHAPTEHGLRSFQMGTASVDVAYTLSDAWKVHAFGSRGRQTVDAGHSTGYDAILKDTATSFGVGASGKPSGPFKVGGDVMWVYDRLRYHQAADPLASAANLAFLNSGGGLPDVTYRLLRFNLFGEYAVQKNTTLRLDLVHHRTFFNEWTYELSGIPYLYSDNTTLSAQERQKVTFIGASIVHKF